MMIMFVQKSFFTARVTGNVTDCEVLLLLLLLL